MLRAHRCEARCDWRARRSNRETTDRLRRAVMRGCGEPQRQNLPGRAWLDGDAARRMASHAESSEASGATWIADACLERGTSVQSSSRRSAGPVSIIRAPVASAGSGRTACGGRAGDDRLGSGPRSVCSPAGGAMPRAVVFIIAGALLLWVAVYNGYPLVWWDSGAYVRSSFVLAVPESRPIFYGLFLLATHWRLKLWGAVVAQSAMVVSLLGVSLRHVGYADGAARRRDGDLLWITACLAVGTSLPWLTGWIMPDAFTGVGVLSLFLVLFHRLSRGERTAVGAMLILSIVVHSSHLPLAIALALLVQCASLTRRARTLSTGGLRMAWLCVAISLLLMLATNWILTGRAFLSHGAPTFILARLLDDGIPQKLLAEHCAERQYQLCAYRDDLPHSAGYYMWNPDSPLQRIGGWSGSQAESWRLIRDCLREYPLLVARGAAR